MKDVIELTPLKRQLKRLFDLVISVVVLFLIAPVIVMISVAITLDSKGPILYRFQRYSPDGNRLYIYKFRTMYVSDKDSLAKWATKNDPRITKLGAFLRRTALDELPMFISVVKGDMSIVGPRLKHEFEYERYKLVATRALSVKPGITSPTRGFPYAIHDEDILQKLYTDEADYVKNWTLWKDIKAIASTVVRGFVSSNAY